jgi:DNA-binding NtrC family response regulator
LNRVLVVDDEAPMRTALEAHFVRDGWDVTTAYGARDAMEKFHRAPYPLVITDMRMPDGDGLGVMRGMREVAPQVGIVFLTAYASVPEAVQAMREGACDYLVKPVRFDQLKEAAQRVLAHSAAGTEPPENGLVGNSLALKGLLQRARQVARSDMDILISAESGTGKELLARLIHQASDRRNRPFVAVNCAAFPDSLLESELFGYARGAFTGAVTGKPGKFELAHTGTMLLDEIGEMPLQLQPKLLRVLQEREVDRLGETRTVRVDVRVIATTNQPLAQLVEQGRFRADLFYRLNVVPFTIPPLRERRGDVRALIEHFLRKYRREGGAAEPQFSPELMARLEAHDWPGNVRELENAVRRAIALYPGGMVGAEFFAFAAPRSTGESRPEEGIDRQIELSGAASAGSLREMERQLLIATLEAQGGNRTRAARALGICPRTMRNKIREYGLPPRTYRTANVMAAEKMAGDGHELN